MSAGGGRVTVNPLLTFDGHGTSKQKLDKLKLDKNFIDLKIVHYIDQKNVLLFDQTFLRYDISYIEHFMVISQVSVSA